METRTKKSRERCHKTLVLKILIFVHVSIYLVHHPSKPTASFYKKNFSDPNRPLLLRWRCHDTILLLQLRRGCLNRLGASRRLIYLLLRDGRLLDEW
jgi:hypothetical protein